MALDQRIIHIVELLAKNNSMSSKEIADILGISSRTVRESITRNKKELAEFGIEIHSHFKNGYSVTIQSEYKNNWKKVIDEKNSIIPTETHDKITYIIQKFILEDDYIKLDDLCDELWISRSTMNRLFKDVRQVFDDYHLVIHSKPSYGLKLEGAEIDKRICLVHNCIHTKENALDHFIKDYDIDVNHVQIIKQIVINNLKKYSYKLTDTGFSNLIIHLIVAIKRIEENQTIDNTFVQLNNQGIEFLIANDIVEDLQKRFDIFFQPQEVEYVRIHLCAKKLTQMDEKTVCISKEMEDIIKKINKQIKEKLGYDFENDFELFTLLALHMIPLIVRVQYGLEMPNPILKDIKLKMVQAYECAVIAAKVIQEEYQKPLAEGELGYLALHYSMAIERINQVKDIKKIVIVCSSGMGTSSLLKQRLIKKFHIDESHILVCDSQSIQTLNLTCIDYVISTVKLDFHLSKPVIYMDNIFDDIYLEESSPNKKIVSYLNEDFVFLQQKFSTKDEILHFMCEVIEKNTALPFSFRQLIEEREKVASTEVGNLVAIPHPLSLCTDESYVVIMTLKKSILWKDNYVKYIFLISGNKNSKEESEFISESIVDYVMDNDWLQKLDKVQTFEELKGIL